MPTRSTFRRLERSEQERLFLDILETPPFPTQGGWAEWFHTWLEDQTANGFALGEIARRVDLPRYDASDSDEASRGWGFLARHVAWMIEGGYARVVRIQIVE